MTLTSAMGGQGRLQGLRVLLVEDADDVREAFALLLEGAGAEVVTAASATDALARAGEDAFDVLLTDLGLPDVPGDQLIRAVLTSCRPRPAVVVVSGFGEPYLDRARAAGASAVLTKPVEWPDLVARIESAVDSAVVARPSPADGNGLPHL
jgi:CheY-like chemotaxis protein